MPHRVVGRDLRDLFQSQTKLYPNSLGRMTDSRDMMERRRKPPLPAAIASRPDADAFRFSSPEPIVSVMKLRNKLALRIPELSREPLGVTDSASRIASRVERFVDPAVFGAPHGLNIQDLYDLLLVEGEACIIVRPSPAAWRKMPDGYLEDDNETVKKSYRRDYRGRSETEWEYDGKDGDVESSFLLSRSRSRDAFNRASSQYRARHLPYQIELVSRFDMVPLDPQIRGDSVTVQGIVRRTRINRQEAIRRRYRWGEDGLIQPKDEGEGDGSDWWLYEGWLLDEDDLPYLSYSIGGHKTEVMRDGYEPDGVIDLYKTAGLTCLPIAYGYGWRWGVSDPDRRGIPYPWPFLPSWDAKNAFMTGKAFQGWSTGFPGWFNLIPANVDEGVLRMWLDKTRNQPLVINPFEITEVLGSVESAVHSGTGHDINEMIAALSGEVRNDLVSPLATGGGNANSAIERSVVSADTVAAVSDIERSVLAMVRDTAEHVLRVCTAVSREAKKNVCVIGNAENAEPMKQSTTKAIIELDPDWLGPEGEESYDLICKLPRSLEDSLAQTQQYFELLKNGGISWEMWCELIGQGSPELLRAQVLYHQWLMNDPAGRAVAFKDAATYLGDQELADLFNLQSTGQADEQGNLLGMLAGVNGMPGLPPGMPPGAGGPELLGGQPMPTGVALPNIAQSQLAGVVGAGMQAGPQGAISVAGQAPVPIGV